MGRMKVHELAKELNMTSKELVEKLNDLKYLGIILKLQQDCCSSQKDCV